MNPKIGDKVRHNRLGHVWECYGIIPGKDLPTVKGKRSWRKTQYKLRRPAPVWKARGLTLAVKTRSFTYTVAESADLVRP